MCQELTQIPQDTTSLAAPRHVNGNPLKKIPYSYKYLVWRHNHHTNH